MLSWESTFASDICVMGCPAIEPTLGDAEIVITLKIVSVGPAECVGGSGLNSGPDRLAKGDISPFDCGIFFSVVQSDNPRR